MTPRDRVFAALRRQTPDCVPIFELMIDPRVMKAIVPSGDYLDVVEALDIDMPITPTPSAMFSKTLESESNGIRYWRTEWGELRADTGDLVAIPCSDFPIRTRGDLSRYRAPDPLLPRRYEFLTTLLARFRGERAVGIHLHDALSYPSYLMGMENLFEAIYADPNLVHELINMTVEHQIAMVRHACSLGTDYVLFGDDYCQGGGPLMSPKHFREFFLPGLKRVITAAKEAGASFVVKHTDGNVLPLLDMMIEAGIDAIHPCDPSAGLTIASMKARFGDRLCVIGNIDTGAVLCDWPAERVRQHVRDLLREAMPGGGWIISSANTIHRGVRPENYRVMLDTVRSDGWYQS